MPVDGRPCDATLAPAAVRMAAAAEPIRNFLFMIKFPRSVRMSAKIIPASVRAPYPKPRLNQHRRPQALLGRGSPSGLSFGRHKWTSRATLPFGKDDRLCFSKYDSLCPMGRSPNVFVARIIHRKFRHLLIVCNLMCYVRNWIRGGLLMITGRARERWRTFVAATAFVPASLTALAQTTVNVVTPSSDGTHGSLDPGHVPVATTDANGDHAITDAGTISPHKYLGNNTNNLPHTFGTAVYAVTSSPSVYLRL